MKHIQYYSNFDQTNESMKSWLSSFLLMANLGLVPPDIKAADHESKKEFIDSQSQDKIDAVVFYDYLKKYGIGKSIDSVWNEFILKNDTISSSLDDVRKYINQNGKNYYFEKNYTEYDFSNVDIHNFSPSNWMTDMGYFIPDSQEPEINNLISEYEKKTSIEIGIITVKSLGDMSIEEYSTEQFNRLGIGKKGADNGILLVVSMDDRKSRIETGRGMDSFLPDAACYRILENQLKSNFKKGYYYDGILAALTEMKNYLGDEAYEEKVRWLKEKKEKEERESDEWWGNFIDNLMIGLLVSLILGSIGYVIYRGQKSKKVKEDIIKSIHLIDKLIRESPNSSPVDSKYIKSELSKLSKIISEVEVDFHKIKSNTKLDKEEILSNLDQLREMAESSINTYQINLSEYKKKISDVNKLDDLTDNAFSIVDKAIESYRKISDYGYTINSPNKSEIESLIPLATLAASLILSNTDEAVENSERFKSRISTIIDKSKNVINTLSSIESAKSEFEKSDSIIKSKLDEMNKYSKWSKNGEKKIIEDKVLDFNNNKSNLGNKPDYLKLNSNLSELISDINKMKSKWSSRKSQEEEEIRLLQSALQRQRKREEESRNSNYGGGGYSGGGGGSSFSSFGGGGSGGGGASSNW